MSTTTSTLNGSREHDDTLDRENPTEARTETETENETGTGATHFEPIWSEAERRHLRRIATSQSSRSAGSQQGGGHNHSRTHTPTQPATRPELDPLSDKFSLSEWMKCKVEQFAAGAIQRRHTGVLFQNLSVHGTAAEIKLQKSVGSILTAPLHLKQIAQGRQRHKAILQNFDGLVNRGEMLLVLGRPGSGCSTFLKSISANYEGLSLGEGSSISYDGIPQKVMKEQFRGDILYNGETEKHFPQLTVGQTLTFAAAARAPRSREPGMSRTDYINQVRDVVLAVFGLSHAIDTKVGSDYVRGVSGGERKRVSIAEMALAGSPLSCWDNATRGLDSASAFEFVKAVELSSRIFGTTHLVAAYQASQAMYDRFDKVIVLYEGREIFFGATAQAKPFFENMGWRCPARKSTGDFLTGLTSPREREAKEGWETRVPRTAEEFEQYWRNSAEFHALRGEMAAAQERFEREGTTAEEFLASKRQRQAKHTRAKSPYTINNGMQVALCTRRAYQRIWNDIASTATTIGGNIVMALIIASLFYGTPFGTQAFFSKSSLLFFTVLLNSLMTVTEINALYGQRPIVEKHASYAFYHPFAEALAGVVADLTIKIAASVIFNTIIYFLGGLRYEAGPYFIFFIVNFAALLSMSSIFRTVAATTKTISQALAAAGVILIAVVVYTGFVIPRPNMHPWFKWLTWIDPLAFAFEALMVNEFHGRDFPCSNVVPAYPGFTNGSGDMFVCAEKGAIPGQLFVNGDRYLEASFGYQHSHLWRNFGILLGFLFFFLILYLTVTEFNSHSTSSAEALVFKPGHVPKTIQQGVSEKKSQAVVEEPGTQDEELDALPKQGDVFMWRNVCYDIKLRKDQKRLLDRVSGWVKPGTLTALMGVSGAGKTTLLNVLAQRVSVGVVTGDMLVNGSPLAASFPRRTGYVQQQDLHLHTSTVREALRFSALLRQPKSTPVAEKHAYVEKVIRMLNMADFADAVIGVPGEGLNVEQRKLLTIGVELAAKPTLLLFLDEPTSGLDSQSSWSIVSFLRKLADNGQAVLSTIHQPSATLFEQFDRLLFLAQGGRTVYFGDIGDDSRLLLDYFERNGARRCGDSENPAEYILELAGAGSGAPGQSKVDWPAVWRGSSEAAAVEAELDGLQRTLQEKHAHDTDAPEDHTEFAMPLWDQLVTVSIRVFQQYWRTPTYIGGKYSLGIASALFIGFSFYIPGHSIQAIQSMIFAIFMMTAIFAALVQQVMPQFIFQRDLYEVRERPSRTYHWAAFMVSNILVEIPYAVLLGIMVFAAFTYAVFGITSGQHQALLMLFCVQFFVFGSTFAHMVVAALPDAETAGQIATLLFYLTLTFNGVLLPSVMLPGFWIFMYRVSPMTYIVNGIATVIAGRPVHCATKELSLFQPYPSPGTTCGQYMARYLQAAGAAGGALINPDATADCQYCSLRVTDQFLGARDINANDGWRDFGIVWAFVAFNIAAAISLYYLFRVKTWGRR
ncbi:ATPase [Capronia epimyces CBS 606.96]|uniref:ATPase n=1 Tax=Capronia epimyces CBS 606.96 TaxID=1182542 RepID=W9XPF1_9EURO|nr:ATPase [Capronia epimyces CBS 606.96]EXJ79220.1 ATPase [Capronia epimyces CBS 606.96]